jgi:hypothetical protein
MKQPITNAPKNDADFTQPDIDADKTGTDQNADATTSIMEDDKFGKPTHEKNPDTTGIDTDADQTKPEDIISN